jgi:long-subunit acyl-CoA synthetase (AMP-forming)
MECQTGESGYVWLNTPALMKGYFRRDDLTAKAVVDGWFMTGDIGFLDEQGRLCCADASATRLTRAA